MAFKFQNLIPQKAHGKMRIEYWTDLDWIAQLKEDGDRRLGQFLNCRVRYTGTPSKLHGLPVEKTENVPHLNGEDWKPNKILNGTVIDGEMTAPWAKDLPGGKSKFVTSIMGSGADEAIRKQREFGWLQYVVFDCLFYKGTDLRNRPLRERQSFLEQVLMQWACPNVEMISQKVGDKKHDWYDMLISQGHEGVVLKHRDSTYTSDSQWVKVKGSHTADVVIMGFKPAEPGKYEGQVGAIRFGQYKIKGGSTLVEMGTCSGFDDALRKHMTEHKNDYYLDVIEIKHYGREPSGAFRHPQFKRFRPDKRASACVFNLDEI